MGSPAGVEYVISKVGDAIKAYLLDIIVWEKWNTPASFLGVSDRRYMVISILHYLPVENPGILL